MSSDPPISSDDNLPARVRWVRVGLERIRPASQVDRRVLDELVGGSGQTVARLPAPASDADQPAGWRPTDRVRLVERDHRIVAGMAFAAGRPNVESADQPWSRIATTASSLYTPTAPSTSLIVTALVYRPPDREGDLPADWLEAMARRLCQQVGARRIAAYVPVEFPADGADWSPEAFVQQRYFGAIDDRRLSPFIAADFVPRGVLVPDESPFDRPRTLMVWENTRR